jgi:hypothetical protein
MSLTAQFGLAAILLAILGLREPPNTITVVAEFWSRLGRFHHMGGGNECWRGVLWGQRTRGPKSD